MRISSIANASLDPGQKMKRILASRKRRLRNVVRTTVGLQRGTGGDQHREKKLTNGQSEAFTPQSAQITNAHNISCDCGTSSPVNGVKLAYSDRKDGRIACRRKK